MVWRDMLRRCFDMEYKENLPTYDTCTVCDEWLNFQNFAKWYYDNYYVIPDERIELDKDILIKGNKLYSKDTCVFVSHAINSLFTKRTNCRGKYKIGVSFVNGKYKASCHDGTKKRKNLGTFSTEHEAFLAFKEFKEKHIKEIAEKYKEYIPQKLYRALYAYEVQIND